MRILAMTSVALVLSAAGGASAQTIECGGAYSIQRGDTLRGIAGRAYGSGEFRPIYDANLSVIGPNPNLIEVGMLLQIPCLSAPIRPAAPPAPVVATPAATPPVTAPSAAAAALAAAPGRVAAVPGGPARLLGVDGNAPFSGGDLTGGGDFTELLTLALTKSGAKFAEVDFAPDWAAQSAALLPGGGYDVGFPWVRPDCDRPAALGVESRARCRSFEFSDPFLEVVLSFYTLDGSEYAGVKAHEEMLGARICRPQGMFVGDLEAEGLVEPNVSLVTPPTAQDCFEALLIGEVNIVSMDAQTADRALIDIPGGKRKVRELDGLATLQTLHAVTARGSIGGRAALAQINDAVRKMRETGEWNAALQKFQSRTSSGG